jgi:hypothetical protein
MRPTRIAIGEKILVDGWRGKVVAIGDGMVVAANGGADSRDVRTFNLRKLQGLPPPNAAPRTRSVPVKPRDQAPDPVATSWRRTHGRC